MSNPSRPESASDERSPDAAGAGPDADEDAERDAGALRARLSPVPSEGDDDRTDD